MMLGGVRAPRSFAAPARASNVFQSQCASQQLTSKSKATQPVRSSLLTQTAMSVRHNATTSSTAPAAKTKTVGSSENTLLNTFNPFENALTEVPVVDRYHETQSLESNQRMITAYINKLAKNKEFANVYDFFQSVRLKCNVYPYTAAIHALGQGRSIVKMKKVYQDMLSRGIQPTLITYNSLLAGFGKQCLATEGYNVYLQVKKQRNVQPDPTFFFSLLLCFRKKPHDRRCKIIFRQLLRNGMILQHEGLKNVAVKLLRNQDTLKEVVESLEDKRDQLHQPTYDELFKLLETPLTEEQVKEGMRPTPSVRKAGLPTRNAFKVRYFVEQRAKKRHHKQREQAVAAGKQFAAEQQAKLGSAKKEKREKKQKEQKSE